MIKSINLSFDKGTTLLGRFEQTIDFYVDFNMWCPPVSFEFNGVTCVFTENFLGNYDGDTAIDSYVEDTILKAVEEGKTYVLFE